MKTHELQWKRRVLCFTPCVALRRAGRENPALAGHGLAGGANAEPHRRASFTLVELLVVIAIIGILASLLSPALKNARDEAKAIQCLSNVHQLLLAFHGYANDNNDKLPNYLDVSPPPDYSTYWAARIGPYLGHTNNTEWASKHYLSCPSVKIKNPTAKTVDCPNLVNPASIGAMSYGVNYSYFYPALAVFNYGNLGGSSQLSKLKGGTMLIGDSCKGLIYSPADIWPLNNATLDGNTLIDPTHTHNQADFIHHGAMNIGCADGSARRITLDDWKVNKNGVWGP